MFGAASRRDSGRGAFRSPPRDRWVLVVDDDTTLLRLTHDTLVAEGLDVVTASAGPIALDLLWSVGEDQPDLIILDLDLPELGGAAMAALYARIPVPHAPILICSGSAEAPAVAGRIGAAGLLRKPFDLDELIATASTLIEARAA